MTTLFSSCSLLFIGASLGADRTVSVLQQVHQKYAGIRHFAIMEAPADSQQFDSKLKHLRTCGIIPLWYFTKVPEDHAAEVEKLIARIVERISVKTVQMPTSKTRSRVSIGQAEVSPPSAVPPRINVKLDRAVRLIEDGQLVFFLGAAIHAPTPLMADEFYKNLARTFECDALKVERFAVAQYIADRHGRENLYAEIRKLFVRTPLVPRDTHKLLTDWPQYKTHREESVPFPLVITTNYDDVLERSLTEAKLPYHLLSYQADGPHRGLFYHRCPDDKVRIIERPHNIREFSDGFVVVKLNGGFGPDERIRESYATTKLDFWDLAARIPDVLPDAIQQALSKKSLLFIGHGLVAQDVESLVRFAHKDRPGLHSWAVVRKKHGTGYWRQCGVEILNTSVDLYVNELRRRLSA